MDKYRALSWTVSTGPPLLVVCDLLSVSISRLPLAVNLRLPALAGNRVLEYNPRVPPPQLPPGLGEGG